MATHSSILDWKIPWTEEPGRLQSLGSQRVGHNLATEHIAHYNSTIPVLTVRLKYALETIAASSL